MPLEQRNKLRQPAGRVPDRQRNQLRQPAGRVPDRQRGLTRDAGQPHTADNECRASVSSIPPPTSAIKSGSSISGYVTDSTETATLLTVFTDFRWCSHGSKFVADNSDCIRRFSYKCSQRFCQKS